VREVGRRRGVLELGLDIAEVLQVIQGAKESNGERGRFAHRLISRKMVLKLYIAHRQRKQLRVSRLDYMIFHDSLTFWKL